MNPIRPDSIALIRRRLWTGLSLGAIALLAGCSLLPKPAPVELYRLPSSLPQAIERAPELALSLRIARPAAGALLAGQRILVLPDGQRVSYYKGANWAEPAPVLLRNRLLDTLRADGRIATLSSDDRILQADFELDGDLRAFQSSYADGRPRIDLRLDLRLVRAATQRIVASRSFELRQPATGQALPEVVQAFGTASDTLALQVADWVVAQLSAAPH